MPSSFTDMTALRVACGNSCLRWRSSAPSVSTSSAPGSLRFVPHAHGSEVRSLPLITSHVLLRSRFAHALRSLVSQRKRRAAAHNRVVLGSENLHSRSIVNQGLGGRGCNRGSEQPSHRPLCRAFADPGLGLNLCPRTALMPEEHNPERVHQCMLCRTL